MSCVKPLKGFKIGVTKNGKANYKVVPYWVEHIYQDSKSGDWKLSDRRFEGQRETRVVREYVEIPCGNCIGCRLKYSRDWAGRMMFEASQHDHNYFVTLTYDDRHLPINSYLNEETGETGRIATLWKRDCQLFMKRLREAIKKVYPEFTGHVKYYIAGEYGGATRRPHYHVILFDMPELVLVPYKRTEQGFWLYNSPFLETVWKNTEERNAPSLSCSSGIDDDTQLGFVVVGEVTFETCAYVARYVLKKQKGEASSVYEEYNFSPEFSLSSRRPAVGREFFDKYGSSLFDTDYVSFPTADGAKKIFMSKYYERLLEQIDLEKYNKIKEVRQAVAENTMRLKDLKTSQSYLESLESVGKNLQFRTKSLVRTLE